jgi:hypothetical protein
VDRIAAMSIAAETGEDMARLSWGGHLCRSGAMRPRAKTNARGNGAAARPDGQCLSAPHTDASDRERTKRRSIQQLESSAIASPLTTRLNRAGIF